MTDNIKPEHYRKGEIDLYEAFSQIFPHNEYRAGMQMIAMRYMFRDKVDRVEDISKAIYSLERLKEKEIERAGGGEKIEDKEQDVESIYLLKGFLESGFNYLARDAGGELWMYMSMPTKKNTTWDCSETEYDFAERVHEHMFPEVKWNHERATKISVLLEIYQNRGKNGNEEG